MSSRFCRLVEMHVLSLRQRRKCLIKNSHVSGSSQTGAKVLAYVVIFDLVLTTVIVQCLFYFIYLDKKMKLLYYSFSVTTPLLGSEDTFNGLLFSFSFSFYISPALSLLTSSFLSLFVTPYSAYITSSLFTFKRRSMKKSNIAKTWG